MYILNRKDMDRKMLESIDLRLEEELLMYKKYINYINLLYDGEFKNICIYASQKHKENYKNIMNYIINEGRD